MSREERIMGNPNSPNSTDKSDYSKDDRATSPERRLRGEDLGGAEQKRAVDHADYEKRRDPDTELRLNDEQDSLYDDGLDIEADDSPLAGTRGPSSGIKP
jgi:hypothetical protein